MQPDPVARNIDDGAVDRLDDALDKSQEIRERPVVVGQVPFEREFGAIELQQEPVLTIVSYSILSAAASAAR